MKVVRILLATLAFSMPVAVKADYLFTWHFIYPQLQKFQGTFKLTDAEMQIGSTFNSELFRNSISINSLDGVSFDAKDPNWSDVGGHFDPHVSDPPFVVYINTHDASHAISLSAVASGTPDLTGVSPLTGSIFELLPNGTSVNEQGWWSITQIPEPSFLGLLAVGALAFASNRNKAV